MTSEVLAHHWSFAIFVLAIIALCLFMVGTASLLGGRHGDVLRISRLSPEAILSVVRACVSQPNSIWWP